MYYMVGAATQQARGKQAQAARTKRTRQESEGKAKKDQKMTKESRDETAKAPGEPSNQVGGK